MHRLHAVLHSPASCSGVPHLLACLLHCILTLPAIHVGAGVGVAKLHVQTQQAAPP
jgi:hypothetical protein